MKIDETTLKISMSSGKTTFDLRWPKGGPDWDDLTPRQQNWIRDRVYEIQDVMNAHMI